jgi:hypothetical protein
MALSANTVWEVRNAGNDTNSGGFVAGSTGTDWSQQASPQYAVTDGVTNGTTTITSATANFGTDVVGNLVYGAGGTGSVTGAWYQIISRTNATTIVVDRTTGLTAGTGVTLNIGGALKTINQLSAVMVNSNKAYVKADGTYTTTSAITFANGGRLSTYTSSRADEGQATLQGVTTTGIAFLNVGSLQIRNLIVDCNSLTGTTGISGANYLVNVKVKNYGTYGIRSLVNSAYGFFLGCEVTGGLSAATNGISIAGTNGNSVGYQVLGCNVHDGFGGGIDISGAQGASAMKNIVSNMTGIGITGASQSVTDNTVYGCGSHGIRINGGAYLACYGNLLVNNGGYGFSSSAAFPAAPQYDGNAYYNNTLGTRQNLDDVTGINAIAPYTNTQDIILTANPFTNAAGNDFTINNTAGGGAALRGKGRINRWPGLTITGYPDFGAVQHQDISGGSYMF